MCLCPLVGGDGTSPSCTLLILFLNIMTSIVCCSIIIIIINYGRNKDDDNTKITMLVFGFRFLVLVLARSTLLVF